MSVRGWIAAAVALLAWACAAEPLAPLDAGPGDTGAPDLGGPVTGSIDGGGPDTGPADSGTVTGPIPAYPQRPGDPARGYQVLVNGGYVGCGLPYSAYRQVTGPAPQHLRLPGRTTLNADLPYNFTAFVTSSSVTVANPNCFSCHASVLNGQVVVGLGDSRADFTDDQAAAAELAGFLVMDPKERVEWRKWADRIGAIGPYIQTKVIGANPADNLAAALFAHRDQNTLAWSATPLLEPPPTRPTPVDVPPWWRMKKKNAMFYTVAGRGDHARMMMTASVLCVDSVQQARAIDAEFPDVRAYIASLEAPPFPGPIDPTLAAAGEEAFDTYCSRCHGTYGPDGEYPNLVVDLAEVGTDPELAVGAGYYAERFRNWFNGSFYGELAQLVPVTGYLAPPLDGIWATAPYLHNGSVPDLPTLLDPPSRPTYWSRTFDSADYDLSTLGWRYARSTVGQDGEPNATRRARLYDTTLPGYGNGGHNFGARLTPQERMAVIEYLKTL
jgi:mono/diheme cytochrome c family protein